MYDHADHEAMSQPQSSLERAWYPVTAWPLDPMTKVTAEGSRRRRAGLQSCCGNGFDVGRLNRRYLLYGQGTHQGSHCALTKPMGSGISLGNRSQYRRRRIHRHQPWPKTIPGCLLVWRHVEIDPSGGLSGHRPVSHRLAMS